MRPHQEKRLSNWVVGLFVFIVIAIAVLYAFTKQVPWGDAYEVKAVFTSAQNVRATAPVRIAGVGVGKVTKVEHLTTEEGAEDGQQAAVVTMELTEEGQPLHSDATFKLRPRLFLEGNLFVDVKPGSPSAPVVPEGHTFPIDQTSNTVQIDQVLTTLQSDVREQLQVALEELGAALIDFGGAEGFQEAYRSSAGAFRSTSQVNEAILGTQPHDLSGLIRNLDHVVRALGTHEEQLKDLVTNFRIFSGSFAAQDVALAQAVAELPRVIDASEPAFASLNAAFPPVRAFAREALPGVESTPAALDAAIPFLEQTSLLVSKDELRGLVAELKPAIPPLVSLAKETPAFLEQGRALASCFNQVVIPWSNMTVPDPEHPAAGKVYEETGYGLVGISGESRSGDANGQYIRVAAGSGTNLVTIPAGVVDNEALYGLLPFPLIGARPAIDSSLKTPFRPNQPCEEQDPPNLNSQLGPPPAQRTISTETPPQFADALDSYKTALDDLAAAQAGASDGEVTEDGALEDAQKELGEVLEDYRDELGVSGGAG